MLSLSLRQDEVSVWSCDFRDCYKYCNPVQH